MDEGERRWTLWSVFDWKPPLTRPAVLTLAVTWWLIAIGWTWLSWVQGTFPVGLLWGVGAVLQTVVALRASSWMREREESAAALTAGDRRSGTVLAVYPDDLPWPIGLYRVQAFSIEVAIEGEDHTRWLSRYRPGPSTDP
ncbi:hypothetical protein B7486_64575, partial [cyanobacterium TDX16]